MSPIDHARSWILVAATLGSSVACGGSEDVALRGPAEVELGRGLSSFEPLPASGGELELVGGPQGGFHVFVAARVTGLDVEGLTIEYSAIDAASGEAVGHSATFVSARVVREGTSWVRFGDRLILDDARPDPVRGRQLEIHLRVEEQSGLSATDARTVLIVDEING
jgi:hypothetical protein